tara:strand:- start:1026 stop:1553 length:528 start_codon:yes stop_codon:yes gene_type:complete
MENNGKSLISNLENNTNKSSTGYIKIFAVIIIFTILGFNVFTNLGYITDIIAKIIEPISLFFAKLFSKTTKNVVKTSTAGTREITKTIDDTVDVVDDTLSNNVGQDYEFKNIRTIPKPDDSNSYVQQGSLGKKGYCYVGNWNGYRTCVKVSNQNKCTSGEIYDDERICRNPELRK